MIKLGPAGSGVSDEKGFKEIAELGLNSLEIEFTYSVWMKNDEAKRLGDFAKKLNLELSIHAPYYINLASEEKAKIFASKTRILQSCERGHFLNAKYIVFHCGFYQDRNKEEIFQIIKEQIQDLQKTIKEKKWNVVLAPETTGKGSAFGNLDELLRLKKEAKTHLTIDFAHLKARNNGKIDYDEIFNKIKGIGHIHSHFSGIEFSEKGEKRHVITEKEDIRILLNYCIKYNADITIINESPDPLGDSLKTLNILRSLR